jgi:hypothetical protein
MGILAWALIAAAALLTVSFVVGLACARMLGQIAEDVTDLLDEAEWSAAPLTRALEAELETDNVAADVRREQTA